MLVCVVVGLTIIYGIGVVGDRFMPFGVGEVVLMFRECSLTARAAAEHSPHTMCRRSSL